MNQDPQLRRLAYLAEVQPPNSDAGAGAAFLRSVADTFTRMEEDSRPVRVADVGRAALRCMSRDGLNVVTVAGDLGLPPAQRSTPGMKDAAPRASEALLQTAVKLAAALFAESRWKQVSGAAKPEARRDDVEDGPLSQSEDAQLRSLTAMREVGKLSPESEELWAALRRRDQRATVREPDVVTFLPPPQESE